jgi:hypothetical protein
LRTSSRVTAEAGPSCGMTGARMEEDDSGEAECGRGERVSEGMHETPLMRPEGRVGTPFPA